MRLVASGAGWWPGVKVYLRLGSLRPDQVLFVLCLVAVAGLVLPPFVVLLRSSMVVGERLGRAGEVSLGAYAQVLGSPALVSLAGNTLLFAAGSALVGLLLGGCLAWCTERTNLPLKGLVYAVVFVSFAVPGILRTIGWIFLLGPRAGALNQLYRDLTQQQAPLLDVFSLPAMVLVEGLLWTPVTFLMVAANLRSMDPSLEEAAYVSGAGTLQTLRRVTARLALPSLLSVLILMFIRSVQAFEVPLLLGVPGKVYVFTTEVYLSVHGSMVPDYSYASAYGVVLVGFLAACIYVNSRLTRHALAYATITGKGFRPRTTDLGPWVAPVLAFVLLVLSFQLLPVAYLVFASFLPTFGLQGPSAAHLSVANYEAIFRNPTVVLSIQQSLVVGFVSASTVVLMASVIAWVLVRGRIRARHILDHLASLPLVFPGIVMGVAVLALFLRSPIPAYGTIWIIAIAYVISFLPYGVRYVHPGVLQIHPDLEDSAQLSGANWRQTFRRIVLPLLRPSLFAAWVFVFLISLRELSIAALLYTAKSPVIATTTLDLWENGNVNQVSAFGAVVAALSIAFAIIAYRLSGRWGLQG